MSQRGRLVHDLAGRYVIERQLGAGGMASVYLATDLKHDRRVALKVLDPNVANAVGPERFLREIEIAGRLAHPNILGLYDSGEAAGTLFYTMPFVDGESLADRLAREGQLPIPDALQITREVADALSYAHERGIIHRDIKPDNIMLQAGHAMVADFGIARAIDAAGDAKLTETGIAVGTPAYMSPEQSTGERAIDARSDVYALGSVLYEMLAGEPPFTGPNIQAVIAKRLSETVPRVRVLRETVPPGIEAVIQCALAKAPADRFPTAAAFIDALETPGWTGGTYTALVAEAPPRRWRVAPVLGIAAVAVGIAFGVRQFGNRPPATIAADANRLGVAPFREVGSGLPEGMGEDLAFLVNNSLDGAGTLRSANPDYVIRQWDGLDEPTAESLASAIGLGLVITGRVVAAGDDSLRISADVFDANRNEALGEPMSWRLGNDRIDNVADSVSTWVLGLLSQTRDIGAARLRSIGSRSPEAIRAFLQGERYYRAAAGDSALASYQRAIRVDSGFALAWSRLGWVEAVSSWSDVPSVNAQLRAGQLNRGLARRESLLLVADSLQGAFRTLEPTIRSTEEFANTYLLLERSLRTLELAEQEFPDDAQVHFRLADSRLHFTTVHLPDSLLWAPFARAVELDPGFALAYGHLLDKPERAVDRVAHIEGLLAATEEGWAGWSLRRGARLARDLLLNEAFDPNTVSDTSGTGTAINILARTQDAEGALLRLLRSDLAARWAQGRPPAYQIDILVRDALLHRGRLAEAGNLLVTKPENEDDAAAQFIELALLEAVSADSAARVTSRWLAQRDTTNAYYALPWWAQVGDTVALARSVEQMPATLAPRAYLALAQGDTAAAIRRFGEISPTCKPCRLTYATLLDLGGRQRDAVAVLDSSEASARFGWMKGLRFFRMHLRPSALSVLYYFERGRANEQAGNHTRAIEAYTYVTDMWANADSTLQVNYVEPARDGLRRLAAER